MSFILDALKKLEHKRQQGSVPSLLTTHDMPARKPKIRSLWLYLLLGALLLNAGVLLVWLKPWHSGNQAINKESIGQASAVKKTVKETSDKYIRETAGHYNTEKAKSPDTNAAEKALPNTATVKKAPEAKQDKTVTQDQTAAIKADSQKPAPPAITSPNNSEAKQSNAAEENQSNNKLLEKDELPLSLQQELPSLSIAGHIYSDNPSSRAANINGQIVREGETMSNGIKLEEITEEGIILSYKGRRFSMRGFNTR
ncbi:MAG: general secretion pathway protein GspB [Nitrospirae bacterium]|nr:general secretion pathway protein GspB [Nitrospirota bacterium]